QRVLLARAIAQEPRLLLLDEPFNGVDALSQDLLLAALAPLPAGGAAVVMATHALGLAPLACDEVCLLNRHQIGFGPIGTTLTPELLRATYGGPALQLRGGGGIVARPRTTSSSSPSPSPTCSAPWSRCWSWGPWPGRSGCWWCCAGWPSSATPSPTPCSRGW